MDFVFGMFSLVKDVSTVDKEYRNLNLQLKYVLDKSTRLEPKIDTNCAEMAFRAQIFKIKTNECKRLSKNLDELLNAPTIAMKDKVRLSLPFNQTKNEITKSIEELEKIINDIKEDLSEETNVDTKEGGVKRAMSEISESSIDPFKNGNHLSVQEIDEQIEELYEMGATIQEEDIQFSQSNRKENQEMTFEISLHSSPEIMNVIKNEKEDLLKISKKVTYRELKQEKEIKLYTVARINFQKCYSKIRALSKDIDGISTNGHFHFILRKIGENLGNENPNLLSENKKGTKGRLSGSQKPEEEVFFSFPVDERASMNEEFALIVKKENSSKTLYRMCGENWDKVNEDEIQILNGDRLAAFVNPNKKEPAIHYEITYEFNH